MAATPSGDGNCRGDGGAAAGAVASAPRPILTKKDFESDQEVRWCPGCGDYSILNQMQKVLPDLGVPRERIVFISGIGCSSRFPYYLDTYGMHSIHGRAPTFATGLKSTRPELQVWVVTGDGDGLSIGGNHLLHVLRRNVDLNIVLFNNRIYGLTKGQYSPTSEFGKQTKSSPYGTIERPIRPVSFAIAAEATFVARSIDVHTKHLMAMLKRTGEHKGGSFLEVYQNCNIFNDKAFDLFSERSVREDRILELENGEPMIFGKNGDRGIRLVANPKGTVPFRLEVVKLGEGITEADLLVHDETRDDPTFAYLLSQMEYPEFPVPVGVFRSVSRPTYDELMGEQVKRAQAKGVPSLASMFREGETWTVE